MTTLFTGLTPPNDEYIHTPLIEIVPPADGEALRRAVTDAAKYDYILFTSRYAVKYWFEADYEPHIPDGVKVVAIGSTTATALRKHGIDEIIQPDVDDSYGVIRLFEQLGGGRKVMIPRSNIALPIIPEGLRNLGYEVSTVVAYINQMPKNVRKIDLTTIDRIVFTSPSTIDNFVKIYGYLPQNKELVTRGAITQKRLEELMTCRIRKIKDNEIPLLDDFLYEAIFIPEGIEPPSRDIIKKPDLQVYVEDFGKHKGDFCLVAETDGKIVGAVWVRIMNDYGHIDNQTPSLAIALYPQYRKQGIGTRLMQQMLQLLKDEGYTQVSLSVQKANYAYRMYRKLGFEVITENDEEYLMVCKVD